MSKLLTSLILAFWVCTIALIAAQNGTRVSLQFLGLQSIQMPLGIVLALGTAAGMVGMAVVLPLFQLGSSFRQDREDFE